MDNTHELTFDPNEVQIHKPLTHVSRKHKRILNRHDVLHKCCFMIGGQSSL